MAASKNSSEKRPYVAHEGDLAQLIKHWEAARDGEPRAVCLTAPRGGGKRAMIGELVRHAMSEHDDVLVWRVSLSEEEDGMQNLLRIYAGLYSSLHRFPVLRGKVEMALNSQIPSQPARVQQWYRAFIEGLKKGAPTKAKPQFQVILPRDNPLVGLVEIANGIARKFPVILELQNVHLSQSLGIFALIESLFDEAFSHDEEEDFHMLCILGITPVDEVAERWFANPLLDFLKRRDEDLDKVPLSPWGGEETGKYLTSKDLEVSETNAARIAEVADGRPGFIAELVDWLSENDKLNADLSDLTMAGVVDLTPDPEELEDGAEDGAEDEAADAKSDESTPTRKRATIADAPRVAHLSALLGMSFPSALVADLGGWERESIDDLLDATEQTYKELQFSEPMGTWIYQFQRALQRESVLAAHTSEEDQEVARRVSMFMERFLVPRGYPYLIKTMRLMAENNLAPRAAMLRSFAIGADQPQMWGMLRDLVEYFDDSDWPVPMRRTIYLQLVDNQVKTGDVKQADTLWEEAMAWASDREDRPMEAWLLFAGSRLDFRRQDLYRARDRANDALTMFGNQEDKLKTAEVHNHLAMIELQDGNGQAALDNVKIAVETAPVPPIQAHALFVQGLLAKRSRQLEKAVELFQQANELAGKASLAPLAMEAGLNLGETLLVSGQHAKAADVLGQVSHIARALRSPVRERASMALLAQASGALKNFEAALTHSKRTLELTHELKFERLVSVDLYNVGFFELMLGKDNEAIQHFEQSRRGSKATDAGFQKELLFHMGQAYLKVGEKGQANEALRATMGPATAAKDWRKVAAAGQQLATLAKEQGNTDEAKTFVAAALDAAEKGGLKDARKAIRKLSDGL